MTKRGKELSALMEQKFFEAYDQFHAKYPNSSVIPMEFDDVAWILGGWVQWMDHNGYLGDEV